MGPQKRVPGRAPAQGVDMLECCPEFALGIVLIFVNLLLSAISATINGITYVYYKDKKRGRWLFLALAANGFVLAAVATGFILSNSAPCRIDLHACTTLTLALFIAVPLVFRVGERS